MRLALAHAQKDKARPCFGSKSNFKIKTGSAEDTIHRQQQLNSQHVDREEIRTAGREQQNGEKAKEVWMRGCSLTFCKTDRNAKQRGGGDKKEKVKKKKHNNFKVFSHEGSLRSLR